MMFFGSSTFFFTGLILAKNKLHDVQQIWDYVSGRVMHYIAINPSYNNNEQLEERQIEQIPGKWGNRKSPKKNKRKSKSGRKSPNQD